MGKEKIGDIYEERTFPTRLKISCMKNVNLIWTLRQTTVMFSSPFYDVLRRRKTI